MTFNEEFEMVYKEVEATDPILLAERLKVALNLALYYIEGDSWHEVVCGKVLDTLRGKKTD
jgi:hypothetical protein